MKRFVLPPETFRIRPIPRSPRYFHVHVARNLTEMRRTVRRTTGNVHPQQLACCVGASAEGAHRHIIGILFFSADTLGVGIVAHEIAHASFRTCERLGLRVEHWNPELDTLLMAQPRLRSAKPEERFCCFMEEMNKNFWLEYYKRDW